MNKANIINICVNEANKSEYNQKVGSVIFKKNRIISSGHNYSQRSAKKLHPKYQKWPGSIHAEVDAIIKAKTDLKGMDIMVIRVNKQNQFRLAKPCKHCQMYLEHVGIRKVYYSISEYPYFEVLDLRK